MSASGVHASGTSSNTHHDCVVPVICNVSNIDVSNLEQIPPTLFELPPGWVEDRFRVDRKRLEQLIIQTATNNNNQNRDSQNFTSKAEQFFNEVMQATNTTVTWPSRLKIGAKSKKDPHIKIVGEKSQVQGGFGEMLDLEAGSMQDLGLQQVIG